MPRKKNRRSSPIMANRRSRFAPSNPRTPKGRRRLLRSGSRRLACRNLNCRHESASARNRPVNFLRHLRVSESAKPIGAMPWYMARGQHTEISIFPFCHWPKYEFEHLPAAVGKAQETEQWFEIGRSGFGTRICHSTKTRQLWGRSGRHTQRAARRQPNRRHGPRSRPHARHAQRSRFRFCRPCRLQSVGKVKHSAADF